MLESLIGPFKNLDRRVKVAIAATGLANFANRMTTRYDPLYAADLGASPADIGLLTSISQAFTSIIALPMGWAVENYSVKKIMLFNLALFAIHLTIIGTAGNWLMLIPGYIISTRLLRMGPLADIIFVTTVEPQRRGTVISLSRVFWNILSIFAPMIAAVVVTNFGGPIPNAQGIRPLYFIELAVAISVFILVARFLPPTLGRVDKKDKSDSNRTGFIQGYREALKGEKHLKLWVVLRIIRSFATSLAAPFTVLWLVEAKGADAYTLGILGSTSLIVTLFLQIPAGRMADKIGRKRVYFSLHAMAYIGTLIALLTQGPEYLILAGLLGSHITGGGEGGGGISGAAQPLFVTWWWESVPEEKRGRFFGIEALFSLAAIPASILGGILWQQRYALLVLLFPILLEVVTIPMLLMVPDIIRSKQ